VQTVFPYYPLNFPVRVVIIWSVEFRINIVENQVHAEQYQAYSDQKYYNPHSVHFQLTLIFLVDLILEFRTRVSRIQNAETRLTLSSLRNE